ncbi:MULTISPECIES: DUF3152 domain-containing protein [Mycobacteriaceae]|uniref:DUF3152 domain-containing protein n=2 Tax=Mycobacteriaceae TaxID=1762 RepID=A0AAP7SRN6_9MYCO|nr:MULTISPECIES: DUF3152 domain-containing protein [Mycobacteriaceae]MBX8691486.1 DUF3152 domain-containing protein [Mycobacterium sp. 20091114027_K0903767]OCB45941.1 hypothetical protein A5721_16035 [Mycolicibacterium vulneris]MCV7389472.1 DUF3152 domain-containing protein [Mycolicibacterium porcinum]OCB07927.1 hypothetical protein A5717_30500 [Mycolicibacterium porcinum]ODR20425.1 hypothetical protein BHQ19_22795 [Mycolicibacterium porcinum]
MTYDPGRRGGGRVPALRNEWREPLRAQRDPIAVDSGRARSNRDDHQQWRKQTWIGRFVSTYGWRAYALPVLIVLTVVVVYQTITGTSAPHAAQEEEGPVQGPPTIDVASTSIIGAPPKGLTQFDANLPTGILPAGGQFTEAGARTWRIVPGTTPKIGEGTTKSFTYSVEVEDGVDTTAFGGDEGFAHMVSETLANPKSWTHNGLFAFTRVDAGSGVEPDFRVSLTSPMTVREGCGYDIELESSCYNPSYDGNQPRVFVNEARWVRGAVPFQGDIGSYRQYLINHEVGHAIGYQRHEACEANGKLAPIMMQQTFSTSNDDAAKFDPGTVKADGLTCRFNPWPYPIA